MARYFFDVDECGDFSPDAEGIELPDIEAARVEAIRTARKIMQDEVAAGRLCLSCGILIRVGSQVAERMPFRSAVTVVGVGGGGVTRPRTIPAVVRRSRQTR